jgi:hypothetical protein
MRTIETALWPLEQPSPDVGVGVFLGEEQDPRLAGLAEGERVLLVEPHELQAEATVRALALGGRRVWFGEIGDPDGIRVTYPDPATSARHSTEAGG